MHEKILHIISGTPLWVWFVLYYLLVVGIKATKERDVYLPKLFIIPVVLTAMKYKIFINATMDIWITYFITLIIGLMIGYMVASREKIEVSNMMVRLQGSYQTLIILLLFFSVKYIFGYLNAAHPELIAEYLNIEIVCSGIFSGYFLGKAVRYLKFIF